MLAELLNVPNTPEEQMRWAFSHQDQHVKINNAIYQQKQTALPTYSLDPMPLFSSPNIGTWQYIHQSAHSSFDAVLKIGGNDLTSVDFKQQDQVASWIRLHFQEHLEAQKALGFPD